MHFFSSKKIIDSKALTFSYCIFVQVQRISQIIVESKRAWINGKIRIRISLPKSFQVKNLNVWPRRMKKLSQSSFKKMQPTRRNDFELQTFCEHHPKHSNVLQFENKMFVSSKFILNAQFSTWNKWQFSGFTT